MSGLYLQTCTSDFKSVALTILELLTFNTQKFWGSHTLVTPLFQKILRSLVKAIPRNMPVKFKVRSFNRFGAISI